MSTRGGSDYNGRQRPATAQVTQQTLREQGAEATRQLREALNLPIDVSDTSILGTALARAAVSEMKRNARFAQEVQRHYDELQAQRGAKSNKSKSGSRHVQPLEPLVALRHTGKTVDPYTPVDPQELIYVYGADKLARALHEYTLDKLKMTAAEIERRHPGTKPTSRANKAAVIAYIVEHTPMTGH